MNKVRCAIYTRKSSEEGLEQDFNSLHAQREACAAYVLSQASEGWQLIPETYDDGGISGGTLERPALQRLLADVAAGRIDIIVVYKVDRLTRSLLDFAKLVEAFDKAQTSFVSVTQSFNTTTSMGRLTLNMLLSFAQFEREVTAERIRDKLAASKARGMWMGGTPPLGYRPDGRSLAIVEEHAALVRDIYARYRALHSVPQLAAQLKAEGIRVPHRHYGSGKAFGGGVFSRGQIYFMLRNPIYAGMIPHKERTYPGQHQGLIDPEEWRCVQAMLDTAPRTERGEHAVRALLAGKLIGPKGEPLISVHTSKGKLRYRYYVSRDLHQGESREGMRIPAREIEGLVSTRLIALLGDPLELVARLGCAIDPARHIVIDQACRELAVTLAGSRRREVAALTVQVRVGEHDAAIDVDSAALAGMIGAPLPAHAPAVLTLAEPVRLTRTGKVLRLLDRDGCAPAGPAPDPAMIKLLGKARSWWATLCEGEINIDTLAAREGVTASWLTRVLRLAFLSPAVTEAILDGRTRPGVGRKAMVQPEAVPACWDKQALLYLAPGIRSRVSTREMTQLTGASCPRRPRLEGIAPA